MSELSIINFITQNNIGFCIENPFIIVTKQKSNRAFMITMKLIESILEGCLIVGITQLSSKLSTMNCY